MRTIEEAVEEVGRTLAYGSNVAAEQVAEEAHRQFPESGDCLAVLALTQLWRGKADEALKTIDQAQECDPSGPIAKAIKGEIESYFGRKEEGLVLIEEAVAAIPDHWVVLRQAGVYDLVGKHDVARRMIERRIELDPENPSALGGMATHLLTTNNMVEFEQFLDTVPESYRRTCSFHRNSASFAMKRRDLVSAEQHLREAVAIEPESALAWASLATVLANTARLEEAERCAGYAIQINSRSPGAYRALVTVARHRGDKKKQAEYEQKAKECVPGLTDQARYREASEASRRGDNQKRIELLSHVPDDELPMHRGMRLRALAESLRAGKEFEKLGAVLEELEANGDEMEEYFGAKAAWLVFRDELPEAIEVIDRGIQKLDQPISLMADKAIILSLMGRHEDATSLAAETAAGAITSPPRAIHAILVLMNGGFRDEAKQLLTRAERESPSKTLQKIRFGSLSKSDPKPPSYSLKR